MNALPKVIVTQKTRYIAMRNKGTPQKRFKKNRSILSVWVLLTVGSLITSLITLRTNKYLESAMANSGSSPSAVSISVRFRKVPSAFAFSTTLLLLSKY